MSRSGALTLDISAWGRVARGGPRDFASGTDVIPAVRETPADQLLLDERLHFDRGDGPRKIVLGERSNSTEALTLEVEMVELH